MSTNFKYNSELDESLGLFESVINGFEAEETDPPAEDVGTEPEADVSQVEISPPPETIEQKNSEFFINGKVRDSIMDNDPAIMNLIKIMTAEMNDADRIKNYVDIFFTELGLNDIEAESFKIVSGELWQKLETLGSSDAKTSLIEFQTWARNKIAEQNS